MGKGTDRRSFIKGSLLAPAAAALSLEAQGATESSEAPAKAEAGSMPNGDIKGMKVSRLLLGGNLLTHYTHSRDLKYVYNLAAHYNTDEKIVATMALAEKHGINTLVIHTVPAVLALLKRYREELGGKMQYIICPTAPVEPGLEAYRKQVAELVEDGVEAIYLWGVHADRLVAQGKTDLLAEAVALPKEFGVPSGLGGHDLRVVVEAEEKKADPDFYIKTFHHHNYRSAPTAEEIKGPYNEFPGYWCAGPEETAAVMKKVEKPWIAFKVMAAGAIPPKDAFQYVVDQGADHVLAGMFDFEIEEDARLLQETLLFAQRERPWRS